jgi:hypothetical protein
MLNNITAATTNKISIAILGCIDSMINYTNTIEGNVVVTWSTKGKLKATLGGFRLNLLKRYGSGNTELTLETLPLAECSIILPPPPPIKLVLPYLAVLIA